MKTWTSLLAILLTTQLSFAKGKIQNEDIKSLAEITTAGGTMAQLPNDTKIYVTANGINTQLSTAIASGVIGGGGGGSSGIQLLQNPGFETGITQGWTHTGGTYAAVSSGSNLLVGTGSATFQSTASAQSVQSTAYSVPNGLAGNSCAASILFKGGSSAYILEAVDGSANILASKTLYTSSTATTASISFLCPSSGTVQLKIVSVSSGAVIALDQMFLGQNTLIQVSQASVLGTVNSATCALAASSGTGTPMTQTGTSCNAYTTTGAATFNPNDGSTIITGPPGDYVVTYNGTCEANVSSGNDAAFYLVDEMSTISPVIRMTAASSGNLGQGCVITGIFHYTTAATHTFMLQTRNTAALADTFYQSAFGSQGDFVTVMHYPSQSQLAVAPDTINWNVEFYQTTTTGNNLGTGSLTSLSVIADANLASVNLPQGSLPGQVPCSASPSTGLTCSSGTAEIGVAASLPSSGKVEVCATFTDPQSFGSAGPSSIFDDFYIIETADASDTQIQGLSPPNFNGEVESSVNAASGVEYTSISHICQRFNVPNSGKHVYKLALTSAIQGSGLAHNIPFTQWNIHPVTQNVPAPVFVGSYSSSSSGALRMESAEINCSASPGAVQNNGSWISGVTQVATGSCAVVFSKTFNATPVCVGTVHNDSSPAHTVSFDGIQTTGILQINTVDGSHSNSDDLVDLICIGQ